MRKEKIDSLKTNKGITLIALVITIIVLLILAGIAISMLTGENGILNQAVRAKEETEKKSTEETVHLATLSSMTNTNHSIDETELEKELTNAFGEKGTGYTITGDAEYGWKVEVNGQKYFIETSGEVGEASQTIPVDDYGAEVTNYKVGDIKYEDPSMKWRIFLEDGKNIYLIAKDYINYKYAPQSKDGKGLFKNDTDYRLSMNNVYEDYVGSSDIVGNSKFQRKYNKWAYSHTVEPNSKNNNIKAVAYMLDTDVAWKGYAGESAEYAIGGPTLEMFCASYNKKHIERKIEIDENNQYGYKVKWSDVEGDYNDSISELSTTEDLYVINNTTNANALWIASTANTYDRDLMAVYYYGELDYDSFRNPNPGFRPIICLKSAVQLKKIGENYEIVPTE